jgi:hypothetical protein
VNNVESNFNNSFNYPVLRGNSSANSSNSLQEDSLVAHMVDFLVIPTPDEAAAAVLSDASPIPMDVSSLAPLQRLVHQSL